MTSRNSSSMFSSLMREERIVWTLSLSLSSLSLAITLSLSPFSLSLSLSLSQVRDAQLARALE